MLKTPRLMHGMNGYWGRITRSVLHKQAPLAAGPFRVGSPFRSSFYCRRSLIISCCKLANSAFSWATCELKRSSTASIACGKAEIVRQHGAFVEALGIARLQVPEPDSSLFAYRVAL
jgi:hypothetical protein